MKRVAARKKPKVEVRHFMTRGADGVKCQCGGFADPVDTTHEENMAYDCGRYQMLFRMHRTKGGYCCCARAFKCGVCGMRIVGTQAAPEMD